MAHYRQLLQQVKEEVDEIAPPDAAVLAAAPTFVDVRERDEWEEGHIPGALHIPRGFLESRVEQAVPDHDRPLVVYCAGGNRSAFAAKALEELGYRDVVSVAGGFNAWKGCGLPWEVRRSLTPDQRRR